MVTAPEAFTINSQTWGWTRRITVAGELDLLAVMSLRGLFDRLLTERRVLIELDLRGITFMDSAGVHLLSYMRSRAGGRLRVIPSAAVARVVHVAAGVTADQHAALA